MQVEEFAADVRQGVKAAVSTAIEVVEWLAVKKVAAVYVAALAITILTPFFGVYGWRYLSVAVIALAAAFLIQRRFGSTTGGE